MFFRFPIEVLLHSSIVPLMAASKTPEPLAATLIRTTFVWSSLAAILALIVGFILSVYAGMVSMVLWYPLCLDVMLYSLANSYLASLLGRGHFVYSAFVFSLYWIVRTGSSILLVQLGSGALGAVLALPIASLCQLSLCASKDRLQILYSNRVSWRSIRGQVGRYGINVGLERFLFTMDLMIMKFAGADARALGFYAAATNLRQAFQAITGASNSMYLQILSKAFSQGNKANFMATSEALLRDRSKMAGLGILSMPYLPMVTKNIFGKEYQHIQGISVLVLSGAIITLYFSAGRIINQATQEPLQIRFALILFILLNTAGFSFAILAGPHGSEMNPNHAIAQATRCAMVPLLSLAALAIYSVKLGMNRSNQGFPWRFSIASISLGLILSVIASFAPCNGIAGLFTGLFFSGIYFGVLSGIGAMREQTASKTT
jgi:hypothetical protein